MYLFKLADIANVAVKMVRDRTDEILITFYVYSANKINLFVHNLYLF